MSEPSARWLRSSGASTGTDPQAMDTSVHKGEGTADQGGNHRVRSRPREIRRTAPTAAAPALAKMMHNAKLAFFEPKTKPSRGPYRAEDGAVC